MPTRASSLAAAAFRRRLDLSDQLTAAARSRPIPARQGCAVRPGATSSIFRRARHQGAWENPSMGVVDPRVEEPTSSSRAVHELADGLAFWDSRRGWGKDFGNADYEAWAKENPH